MREARIEGKKSAVIRGTILGSEASGDEILTHAVVGIIVNTPFNDYQESDLLRLRKFCGG